jgi:hypothetical protein
MKKLISILSAAAMLAAMTVMPASAADAEPVFGDADGNGKVELSDIDAILDYYCVYLNDGSGLYLDSVNAETYEIEKDAAAEKAFLSERFSISEDQFKAMDTDSDGIVTSHDTIAIINYIIVRDYGDKEMEFTAENLGAIREESKKISNEQYLVLSKDDKTDTTKIISDKKQFYGQQIEYLGTCKKDNTLQKKLYKYIEGARYYEKDNADGTVDIYLLSEDLVFSDVNEDGQVDSLDATLILVNYADRLLNGSVSDSTDTLICSDFNNDGAMDSLDATAILIDYAKRLNA